MYYLVTCRMNCGMTTPLIRRNQSIRAFELAADSLIQTRFSRAPQSRCSTFTLALMLIFASLMGLPWITSAARAIHYFFEGSWIDNQIVVDCVKFFTLLVAGMDSVWIMLCIHRQIFSPITVSSQLLQRIEHKPVHAKRPLIVCVSALLGAVNSATSAYAAFLFNDTLQVPLTCITLIGSFCFAFVGYYLFLLKYSPKLLPNHQSSIDSVHMRDACARISRLKHLYSRHLQSQMDSKQAIIPIQITNFKQLVRFFNSSSLNGQKDFQSQKGSRFQKTVLRMLPFGLGLTTCLCHFFVQVLFTVKLLSSSLGFNTYLSLAISVVCGIPGFFLKFVSTQNILQHVINSLLCLPPLDYCFVRWFYPRVATLLNLFALTLSLASPVAAIYVAYTIVLPLQRGLAIIVAAQILVTRLCFTSFILRSLAARFVYQVLGAKRAAEHDHMNMLFELIDKVQPYNYFQLIIN